MFEIVKGRNIRKKKKKRKKKQRSLINCFFYFQGILKIYMNLVQIIDDYEKKKKKKKHKHV